MNIFCQVKLLFFQKSSARKGRPGSEESRGKGIFSSEEKKRKEKHCFEENNAKLSQLCQHEHVEDPDNNSNGKLVPGKGGEEKRNQDNQGENIHKKDM